MGEAIEPQDLALEEIFAQAKQNGQDSQDGHKSESKTYNIACIDDSPAILNTIRNYLEDDQLQLHMITDSVKALVQLMRIKPDLILMDVGMPQVDGYEICRLLRRHPAFKQTPVVMVTGNTGLIDRAKAKVAGATDYMTKPFTQAQIQQMVFRYLCD